jgi:hypothetical protein
VRAGRCCWFITPDLHSTAVSDHRLVVPTEPCGGPQLDTENAQWHNGASGTADAASRRAHHVGRGRHRAPHPTPRAFALTLPLQAPSRGGQSHMATDVPSRLLKQGNAPVAMVRDGPLTRPSSP